MSSLSPVSGTPEQVSSLLADWIAATEAPPLVIETSGSTGRPKRVALSREAVLASAHATHERLGGPGQWVLDLPVTFVAGVQVLVRSLLAGVRPVVAAPGETLAETLDRMGPGRRYVSLVATQLVRALNDPAEVAALARFDAVLVGGGPLHPAVRARAEAAGVAIVSTYGLSETCGGCVYDGVPLTGVKLRIDAEGQVWVAGPMLFDGYVGEPERTAAVREAEWLRTDDLGEFVEGRLRILGRADSVIISGGVKVPAEAVESMLLQLPGVRAAVVVGVPDPEWGERVVALVEADGAPPTLDAVRDVVTPRSWAPKELHAGPVPLLPRGKVDRETARRWMRDA